MEKLNSNMWQKLNAILLSLIAISIVVLVFLNLSEKKETSPTNIGLNYSDANQFSSTTAPVVTSTYTGSGGLPLLALPRNNSRVYAVIQNDGTADIYIYLNNYASDVVASTTVLANNGIRLVAGGGSYEILPENLYLGDIWVATTTAAQRVLVTEKTAY